MKRQVTAHVNISSKRKNQKRNNLNGRTTADQQKLQQFLLVALRSDKSSWTDVCPQHPKPKAWPPESPDLSPKD